jgi:dynactin complex subunit
MIVNRYIIKALESKLFSIIDSKGYERIYTDLDDVIKDLREDLKKKPEWVKAHLNGGHG